MFKTLVILLLCSTYAIKSHSMSVSEVGESLEEFLSVCATKQLAIYVELITDLINLISGGQDEEGIALKDEPRQIPKRNAVNSVNASEPKANRADTSVSTNKFVDFALDSIGKRLKKKGDELPLPEQNTQINERFWGISLRASAQFYNGILKGMQSIHRVGDSVLIDINTNDSLAEIAFTVELKDIEISYRLNISLLKARLEGRLTGKLKSMKIHVKLNITQKGGVSLGSFDVLNTGLFTVSTTGFGKFNYILSGLGIILGNLSKRMLLDSMEGKIRHRMNAALAHMSNNSQKRSLIVMLKGLLAQKRSTTTALPRTTEKYTSSKQTAHDNSSHDLNPNSKS